MAEVAWIKIHGQDQYKRLAKRLRDAGRGDLQRRLTREIRRQGNPALAAVKSAWATVDVRSEGDGGESSGLRSRVAAATRVSILGSGIRIRVEGRRVDPRYGRSLTYGLNGLGRWRHPVFPDPSKTRGEWTWTQQWGQEVFYKTLERFEGTWRAGIERAMEETAREIAG